METILFATTNKGKIATAKRLVDAVEIIPVHIDLIEPRTDDITEIAKIKAEQAYEATGKPCIVLDAGFFVESLNGFPRAYVNHMLDTIGTQGILKLLDGVANRNACFRECLVYYDGTNMECFYGMAEGTIALDMETRHNTKQWSPLWNIFIPKNCDKTLAEMTDDERFNRPDGHMSSFTYFNNYVNEIKVRQRK